MRTLVTGGAGFIGSNVVDALVERGDEVTVVDNLTTGRRENLERALAGGAQLVEADIRDGEAMRDLCADRTPDVVFHLAAQIDVRRSVADPAYDATINVIGTINMLAAAHAAGARRFVNSSTGGAIYGEGRTIPATEDHPQEPEAGYGQSKLSAEGYVGLFQRLHGFPAVSLRYGNVYGPRQDPLGEAGVVAIFCGKLLDGGRPLVYGDGLQTRDYVYVGDVVSANLAAAEGDAGGAFNVGLGVESTVLDVVEILGRLGGRDGDFVPEFAPERKGEIRRIAIDPSRARVELGWEPRVGLEKGLELTLRSLED
ncbi:MAG: NAD-dependent epimerase/dehydratase family protein [Thermoleophilaceae bacterium]